MPDSLTGLNRLHRLVNTLNTSTKLAETAPIFPLLKELERIRHLKFKYPVRWQIKTKQEIKTFVNQVLKEEYPTSQSRLDEAMLFNLGFTQGNFQIRPFLENLYTEQIGGMYIPQQRTFFIVDTSRSLWTTLRMSNDQQRSINLHELDHALDDQHFDLKRLQEDALRSHSTDRQLALSALLEGDATLVMLDYSLMSSGLTADDYYLDLSSLGNLLTNLTWIPGMAQYSNAPLYFKRLLIFPYYEGTDFVHYIRRAGGWRLVNYLFEHPPQSTEQILHPEKYLLTGEPPQTVTLHNLPDRFGNWRILGDDTGGEFLVKAFLEQHNAPHIEQAAAGWGGDRYKIYQSDHKSALIWLITWDSIKDAQEFRESFTATANLRRKYHLFQHQTKTVITSHFPNRWENKLVQKALATPTDEVKFSRPKQLTKPPVVPH